MEFKWFMIAIATLFLGMGLSEAVKEYSLGQCRVAAINRGMTGEDIAKACK